MRHLACEKSSDMNNVAQDGRAGTDIGPGVAARLRTVVASDPARALAEIERYLADNPRDAEALRVAAAAHRGLGRRELAERAELAALDAGRSLPVVKEGERHIGRQEFAAARQLALAHLARYPDDVGVATIAAEAAIGQGLPDLAIPLLEQVLRRVPSYLLARLLLANALVSMDRLRDARILVEPVVRRMPDAVPFRKLLAEIARAQNDFETAVPCSEALTRLTPASAEAWVIHGDNLRFSGKRVEAISAYRQALSVEPDHGLAWWSLANIDAAAITDDDVARMSQAARSDGLSAGQLSNLNNGLAIVSHVRKDYPNAFTLFSRSKSLRQSSEPHDAGLISDQLDSYLSYVADGRITGDVARSDGTPAPIFIVGMPRSGSTLVERLIGCSTHVEMLGELAIVPHMVERLRRDAADGNVARHVASLPTDHLQAMGHWYATRAAELLRAEPRRPFYTDKLHMNWRHLPLIMQMLPNARIIDVRRNAMDCCWSNFRTLFASGHSAANDLSDIGHFYRDYVRFIDALRAALPGRIIPVRYEDVVDDFEPAIARLFSLLGLEPEPDITQFHRSSAPVATASSEQVRQPLNRNGIGAWRPYAQWLGPLRAALGDLAED